MKVLGFGLLLAGWAITIAAVVLLAAGTLCSIFVLSGVGVEALGLALVIRAHIDRRSSAA
jgi:hypothetical protein